MTLSHPERVTVTQADREALKQAEDVIYGMPYEWLYGCGLTSSDTHAEASALFAIAQTRTAAAIRALPEPAQRSRSTGNEQGNASHA